MGARRITEDPGDFKKLGALFLVALTLRIAHVLTILGSPFFSRLSLDPLAYHEWGMRIASGAWLGDRIFYQDPLYPYFLGAIYALFGPGQLLVVLVQAVAGALVPPLVYLAARRWLGRPAALCAGWIAVLYAPSIYYEGLILKTWMEMLSMAGALCALSVASGSRLARAWFTTGVLFGLGCLVRANFLLLLPTLVAWMMLDRSSCDAAAVTARGRGRESSTLWRPVAALVLGAGLVLGVTAVRNRIVGGAWVLTTAQAGQNFYLGNNALNRNGEYEPLPFVAANPKHEEKDFASEAERRAGRELTPTEVSRFWFREGIGWIKDHPGDWTRLVWKKLRVFWGAYEVPDNLDYYLYLETAPLLRLPLLGFGVVAPLGLVGAVWLGRRRGWPRAVLLVLAVYSASVILFYVFARYRLAMMPVLFPLAGYALVETARRVRGAFQLKESPLPAVALVTAILVAGAFVNFPVRAPSGYWTYRLAHRVGLPARAETTATAHYNLGLAYAREAQSSSSADESLARAEEELREALRQDRRFAKVYVELGKVLARAGKDREAIEVYEASLKVEPLLWRTHHSLGLLYRRTGDSARGDAAFRRAAELEPRQGDSLAELGDLYLETGRIDEARKAFEAALRAAPNHAAARRGVARMGARNPPQ